MQPFVFFLLPQINKTIKLLRVVYFQYELSKRSTYYLRMVEIYKALQKIFPDLVHFPDNVATTTLYNTNPLIKGMGGRLIPPKILRMRNK